MNSKKFKKYTALLITVMLVLSTCITGVSVSAEEIEETTYQLGTTQAYTQPETSTASTMVASETTEVTQAEPSEEVKSVNTPQLYSGSIEPAEQLIESDDITVYFYNSFSVTETDDDGYTYQYYSNWDNVYVYYWSDDNDSMVEWPGVAMDYYYYDDTDYYANYSTERVATIPSDAQYIIFNDNASNQTETLSVPESGKLYKNGEWVDMSKEIVFSDRTTSWGDWGSENSGVYAYYWSDEDDSMVQWPGVELKTYNETTSYCGDHLLSTDVPLDAKYVIFHNNKGAKTTTLTIPDNYFSKVFSTSSNQWITAENSCWETGEYNLGVVVGDEELCGTDWEYNLYDSYENVMDIADYSYYDNYTYTKTYKDVQPANNIQFKIANISLTHGHEYQGKADFDVEWFGDENGNDITFNVTKTCDVTIAFKYGYSDTNGDYVGTITVTGDGVVMSTDTKDDVFKYRVLDDGTAALVAYTKTGYDYSSYYYNDGEKVSVTIPTEIDGYKVTALDGTFAYNKWIEISEIPETITSIGNCTFMTNFDDYYEVEIEIGKNIKNVGDYAYYIFNSEKSYYGDHVVTVLNSETTLGELSIPWYSTIYGYSDSTAETYANDHECTFITFSDGEVIGDIELKLKNGSNGVISGETVLEAGTYNFKIKLGEKEYGGAYEINDSLCSLPYSSNWKKSSTLNATGGKYVFEFDTVNNKLSVFYDAPVEEVKIIGNNEYTLEKSATDANIFKGVLTLGTNYSFSFKVSVDGVEYGCGSYFYESMSNVVYSSAWSSSTTLKTSYFYSRYSFVFDTCKNRLTVSPVRNASSVSIAGDIELSLTQSSTDTNVYSGTVDLEAGEYKFNVTAGDYTYCFGYTFKDYIKNVQYNSNWTSDTTFIATGGTYSFTYDVTTNMLTVAPVK